jgi:hypothetical protein
MKKIYLFISILIIPLLWQCSEPKDWHDPVDNVPPGAISNVRVKNINGGAWIYYSLPQDNDLLGVRAVFSLEDGVQTREAYASAFNDSILIEGAHDTQEYEVKLYVMDKSNNESAPVQVSIQPLVSPIDLVGQSLKAIPTFAGIYSTWENATEEDIAIFLYVKDSLGEMVLHDTYYSKAASGKFSFRNLEATEQEFQFVLRDKWNHFITALNTVLTPLFEEEIVGRTPSAPPTYIWQLYGETEKSYLYRGDLSYQGNTGNYAFGNLHDGVTWTDATFWTPGTGTTLSVFTGLPEHSQYFMLPVYFTIDMGKKAAYSRVKYWMRSRSPVYSGWIFTEFEIWGTNNPKSIDEIGSKADNLKYWTQWPEVEGTDEWKNDWVKLTDGIVRLPSGNTDPTLLTDEDRTFIQNGFEFEIDPQVSDQPFRYLRFVCKKWNNPQPYLQIVELKFWGIYADE